VAEKRLEPRSDSNKEFQSFGPERFHKARYENRSIIFALSHFRTEIRIPLFLKMLYSAEKLS